MSITSTVLDRADIRFHTAAPALRAHVGCFWIITAEPGASMRVVPDGTASIGVALREKREFAAYLRGPVVRPIELRFDERTTLIGVRLRPGVSFSLTGVGTHSLVNRRIDLRDHESFREIASIDPVPRSSIEWIDALQNFLIARLEGSSIHPLVAKALAEIQAEKGNLSIPELAVRCGTGERNLSRLMRDWIGYGPKRYAGIVRFQSTLAQMEQVPPLPIAMLAMETGYFDQSHLTADIARYAGATPGRLISESVADFAKTYCDVPY